MTHFVGRAEELRLLNDLLEKNSASLVVVFGRRRIGKSRLIEEFGRHHKMLTFAGLAPQSQATVNSQLAEFGRQMTKQLPIPQPSFADWSDAFNALAHQTQKGRVIIFFDEIPWMGSCDPDFLGKLKNAWDMEFKKNDRLILIVCGSVSTWVYNNILANTGFYGRVSLKLHIKELPLKDCNHFWLQKKNYTAPYEKLKLLAVTGGIPKYLEEIKTNISSEDNIRQLCFLESGLLFSDFDYIFYALLQRKSHYYEQIVSLLKENTLGQSALLERLDNASYGAISGYLEELVISGFVERDYTWQIKTGTVSKLSQYRLSDNYLRFYLKYIQPNIQKIKHNQFKGHSLTALPGWASIMGLQIENLVLNNRHAIIERLGLHADEVIYDNPYFQRPTARHRGCQIDYMIQTKCGNLYVCEIKFSRNTIKKEVIESVQEKIKSIALPRNFSIKPVLIHVSDVHDDIVDSGFFVKTIDLADLFSE